MTINLADNTPRVSYAVAQGATQTSFTVSFEFFDAADLNVYVDGTLKTITTHYTVSGGDGSTGTVTMSVTGATGGSTVVITRDIDLKRTTDFPASGSFQIGSLNTELDKLVAIAADLDDKASRALQLTDFDTAVSLVLPDVNTRKGKTLAFNASTGAVEAGPSTSDVQTVSATAADIATLADIEDGTDATDAIQTVAGIASNVTTVAGVSSNVTTVAGQTTNMTNITNNLSAVQNAATNATTATTKASEAATSATNAASSATSAANSAATLTTGISENNIFKAAAGVVDDDFLRVAGTAIEGRSASEVLSDIGAAPAAGSSNIVTTGALNSGSITSGFGTIDTGSSNITTTGVGSFGSLDISGDIDVDGTTNLDAVDIDGAVDMASTLTVSGAFTSPGIDDNADATAITIDSSENVMIGTTDTVPSNNGASGDAGVAISPDGVFRAARSGNVSLDINRMDSDGEIATFRKDGSTVGLIGSKGGDLTIGTGVIGVRFEDSNNAIVPFDTSTAGSTDNDIDLGKSSVRWNDLYLGGNLYIGGTGSANALSDYEEGTFTPAYTEGLTSVSYQFRGGKYTKVGRFVYFQLSIRASAATTNGNQVRISGLPFNSDTSASAYGGAFLTYNNNFYVQLGGPTLFIQENDTHVLFYKKSDGGTLKGNDSDLQELNDIHINGFYKTA